MLMIDQLMEKIDEKSNPTVVGLDPLVQNIPKFIQTDAVKEFGNTRQGVSKAFLRFNLALLDQLHPLIPAVKLQMACYELYGEAGINAFNRTVERAHELNLVVIDDSKRNDIGSSAKLYAMGHLGKTPLFKGEEDVEKSDFLTINPFLGSDTISPFVDQLKENNKGVFILARTSNPSSKEYQEALIEGKPLYTKIAEDIHSLTLDNLGARGYSPIGAVVGATWPEEADQIRQAMPHAYFLVPGYGAQGATADGVIPSFDQQGYGALINSSRGVIFAYQNPKYQSKYSVENFAKSSAEAVKDMREDLLRSLSQAGKLPANW